MILDDQLADSYAVLEGTHEFVLQTFPHFLNDLGRFRYQRLYAMRLSIKFRTSRLTVHRTVNH
jgi:hypothetical protein